MNLAQTGVQIYEILQHLHSENRVKCGVAVRRRYNIRIIAFDPDELRASLLCCRNLVRADIDRANAAGRADKSGSIRCVKPASATHFQYPLSSPQIESAEDVPLADDIVMRFGSRALQARQVSGKRI